MVIAARPGVSRSGLLVFVVLVCANALLAMAYYLLAPLEQLGVPQSTPGATSALPAWVLGLANGGIVLVLYGLLGLAGYWLSGRLGLPGIFRQKAGVREWVLVPMAIGAVVGIAITGLDRVAVAVSPSWEGFSHPPFPLSILASASAGIGEEILYRLFVMTLWAFLLNLILGKIGATRVALWVGNLIGALAFGAGHLPTAMLLLGASSPSQIPALVLAELLLLNGTIGIVAGWQYMRNGLVAAAGVHFWADFIWHVLWPFLLPVS